MSPSKTSEGESAKMGIGGGLDAFVGGPFSGIGGRLGEFSSERDERGCDSGIGGGTGAVRNSVVGAVVGGTEDGTAGEDADGRLVDDDDCWAVGVVGVQESGDWGMAGGENLSDRVGAFGSFHASAKRLCLRRRRLSPGRSVEPPPPPADDRGSSLLGAWTGPRVVVATGDEGGGGVVIGGGVAWTGGGVVIGGGGEVVTGGGMAATRGGLALTGGGTNGGLAGEDDPFDTGGGGKEGGKKLLESFLGDKDGAGGPTEDVGETTGGGPTDIGDTASGWGDMGGGGVKTAVRGGGDVRTGAGGGFFLSGLAGLLAILNRIMLACMWSWWSSSVRWSGS